MEQGLISVITPCYNTGNIVYRLLDSILVQDYPHVEMFAVDDGSTDNTSEVLSSYIPRFEERGYRLVCLRQDNQGQSAAVNKALKLVRGEFLTWPDSDDYYKEVNAFTTFVRAFKERGDDFGVVRCLPTYVTEKLEIVSINPNIDFGFNQFENCLYSRNFVWGAGNYVVRMSAFDSSNPQCDIYVEKNAGQNWQMLLPLLYKYKCYTLPKSYFCVVQRASSHSRGQFKGYEQQIQKIRAYSNTIHYTLERMLMPVEEKVKFQRIIKNKYLWIMWDYSVRWGQMREKMQYESELKQLGFPLSLKQKALFIISCNSFVYKLWLKFMHFCKRNTY